MGRTYIGMDYNTTKGWLQFLADTGSRLDSIAGVDEYRAELQWIADEQYPNNKQWAIVEFHRARKWAHLGCPQVVVSDKLFAELALGWDLSKADFALPLPWTTFVVRIPESQKPTINWNLLGVKDRVSHLFVGLNEDPFLPEAQEPESTHYLALQPEKYSGGFICNFNSYKDLFTIPSSETLHTQDAIVPLKNLAGAIIMEMMHPRHSPKLDRCKSTCEKRVKGGDHRPTTLELVRPVTVDLREVLRDVITPAEAGAPAKKRAKVKLQSLIRGHYKRQRHGKGNAQVKYIYVDPYWRGPADAPIAVREHILKA